MKTINFKLSKRLTEGGYLDNIETEYLYLKDTIVYKSSEIIFGKNYRKFNDKIHPYCVSSTRHKGKLYKTLTLEEAIEFLPEDISEYYTFNRASDNSGWYIKWREHNVQELFTGKTLLEAIEAMITYLLDNNLLLGKQ